MADITASGDIAVTVNERTIEGKKKRNRCTIVLGTGGNDYPSGGIPLPTYQEFGMVRNLDYIINYDNSSADGFLWKYDATNNKLRGYLSGATGVVLAELATGTAVTTRTWKGEAVGW